MRKCPSCDSEVSILAERCRYCGKPLPKEEIKNPIPKQKQPSVPPESKLKFWKIAVFALIAAVLLFRLGSIMMSESHVFKKGSSTVKPELEKPASASVTPSTKSAEKKPETAVPANEPNFISVNGKVIPNPKRQNTQPLLPAASASSTNEEPNFISVNGKVIPNPKKQQRKAGI